MIAHGLSVCVALEPVDMRFGYERLGRIVRERMRAEPRSRAWFVFVGNRGHTMNLPTWDGTGSIVFHEKLDAGTCDLPTPTRIGAQHVIVSDAIFEAIFKGVAVTPRPPPAPHSLSLIATRARSTRARRCVSCIGELCLGATQASDYDSDTHAESVAALFSVIASCRLSLSTPSSTWMMCCGCCPIGPGSECSSWRRSTGLPLAPSSERTNSTRRSARSPLLRREP